MPSNMERDRVFEVVRGELLSLMEREGLPSMEVSEQTALVGDVGLSSLAVLDLMTSIEAALDCRFDELEAWATPDPNTDSREFRVCAIVDATWATLRATEHSRDSTA